MTKQNTLKHKNSAAPKTKTSSKPGFWTHTWKRIIIFVVILFASVVLLAGNLLFWAGQTVIDTDQYKEVHTKIIKDSSVQQALASYTTNKIFANNDVESLVKSALPTKADFLAPPLTSRLESYTNETIVKILANEKFQTVWINVNVKAHDSLLAIANSPQGQDGVINLNEFYQQLSKRLKGTKLAILADKQLPPNIGEISVLKSKYLHTLHIISVNINNFKYACLALIAALSALAIWLSEKRRRMVELLSIVYASAMLLTLLSIKLFIMQVAAKVSPEYSTATRDVASIVLHPLQLQSIVILTLFVIVFLAAYIGSNAKFAKKIRSYSHTFLEGKAHAALFPEENKFSLWVGRNTKPLRIVSVVTIVIVALSITLTPLALAIMAILLLLLVGIIDLLAGKPKK